MAPPIARRYDALNNWFDSTGQPFTYTDATGIHIFPTWQFGSAVEIEKGVFLTAAHVLFGPRVGPGNVGFRQVPLTARIDGIPSDPGGPSAPEQRTLTGGLEVDLGSIKNFRSFTPQLGGQLAPVADIAAFSTTSSTTAPQDITGVAVFLQPTLAQLNQYASQVSLQGFPEVDNGPTIRVVGPVRSGPITALNTFLGQSAPRTVELNIVSLGKAAGRWFNYGPNSKVSSWSNLRLVTTSTRRRGPRRSYMTIFAASSMSRPFRLVRRQRSEGAQPDRRQRCRRHLLRLVSARLADRKWRKRHHHGHARQRRNRWGCRYRHGELSRPRGAQQPGGRRRAARRQ